MSSGMFDDDNFDDDDFAVDTTGMTPEDMADYGGACNKAGFYHVVCNNVKRLQEEGRLPSVRFDLQIVDGDHKDQIGKFIYHRMNLASWEEREGPDGKKERTGGFLPLSQQQVKIGTKFFTQLKLVKEEEIGSQKLKWPFSKLRGMPFIAKVEEDKFTGNDGKDRINYKIPFSKVYTLDDERVEAVPKSPQHMKSAEGFDVNDI